MSDSNEHLAPSVTALPILGQTTGAPLKKKLDYEAIRQKLAGAKGPVYWRTLEELADTPEFREAVAQEFPERADEWLNPVSRRDFLKLASVTLTLAGITGCVKQPLEPIIPYVRQPEEIVLGKPLYFATAMPLSGILQPLIAKSNEGRPTKVEGNAQHAACLGGTDIYSQGSIYDLYDPDRSQTIEYLGDVRTWSGFLGAIRGPLNAQKALKGAGLRFLSGTTTSPTLASQMMNLLKLYPQAKWHVYEPINRDMAKLGSQQAFGTIADTQYRIENADVIVSLDANFLSSGFPGFQRYARMFAMRRQPDATRPMLRFYAVETSPTNTGGKADHRLPLRASEFEEFARALHAALTGGGSAASDRWGKWIPAMVRDLQAHRGTSVIIPGETQSPAVHALAHAMNAALGAVGQTVIYTDPVEPAPVIQTASIKELADDMRNKRVDLLVIMGVNPVYDAPADLDFRNIIRNVQLNVHWGLHQGETSEYCQWHIPAAHYLESWSDGRAYDGTVSIIQPLVAPLYGGKTIHEMVNAFSDTPDVSGYDLVRQYWQSQKVGGGDFDMFWRRSLHDGFMANSALPPKTLRAAAAPPAAVASNAPGNAQDTFDLLWRPDPALYDGRFGNNAWSQELDRPLSTMTWDNPVWISQRTADKLHIAFQDVIEIEFQGRKLRAPIYIQPGMPDNTLTLFTGYGHTRIGHTGNGAGVNTYVLRTSDAQWAASGAKVSKTGDTVLLARIQPYMDQHGRELVRIASIDEYKQNPKFAHEGEEEPPRDMTLYPNYQYNGYAWGMAIDLNACVGCNTCIIACQAENNIPVVGKGQVLFRRAMHWLRVDTYYEGDPDNPRIYFEPLPCMQCENAPCEYVCPVGATVHSTEGLNDMVYNRCVGTRYCSNNCPYKVRRFNFLLYQDWNTPQLKLMRNPDVSVRSRGVMEKCTYCVQRITHARIEAEEQDRRISDGTFTTACAQACPADAIVFGDINDPNSRVAKLKANPRNYSLLSDLNTRPRTTYLAGVRNPNPELEPAVSSNKGARES
jgi:molybdopterin-containing oxidoreductase family iron-sulfur binding subunit